MGANLEITEKLQNYINDFLKKDLFIILINKI